MNNLFKAFIGIGGGAISFLFGGWDSLLWVLVAFAAIDWLTGVSASWNEGKLSSKVGFKGLNRKVLIFAMVAVAHLVDVATEGILPFNLRDGVIFFYMANEVISIIENVGRAGLPVPEKLSEAIEVLKGKGKE